MSLPYYDFGPRQLTPEMLEAALTIRLYTEAVQDKHSLLVLEAAEILGVESKPSASCNSYYENLEAIADRVLLAWPEG